MQYIARHILKLLRNNEYNFTIDRVNKFEKLLDAQFPTDEELNRVEIILLKYKSPEVEIDCIANIIKYTTHPYKLNIFDNRKTNPNTSKAWNKLIRESTCPYIVIMDTDAFVSEGWLEPLVECFQKHSDCVMAGLVVGDSSATIEQKRPKDNSVASRLCGGAISGFCFMTTKKVMDSVGYFNEDFLVYGQDSEWCNRLNKDDRHNIYVCPKSYVEHGYKTDKGYQFSVSTKKAKEDKEFDWDIDVKYAGILSALLLNPDEQKVWLSKE